MNLILKHTFKSVLKNKVQAAIIVLTVVLVTALLFAAFSLSDVFYAMNAAEQRRLATDTDMLLGSVSPYAPTFSKAQAEGLIEEGDVAYADYFFRMNTVAKTAKASKSVLIEATDLNTYLKNHRLKFISSVSSISGAKNGGAESENAEGENAVSGGTEGAQSFAAIIGKTFANSLNVKAGDEIEIYLSPLRQYKKLIIKNIAVDEGIFASAAANNILTDFSGVYGDAHINSVFIKFSNSAPLSEPALFSKYENIFKANLPDVPVSDAEVNEQALTTAKNSTMLMTVAVIFITAATMLILLTSYLIIARHRMSDMIIFKACGATPKQATLIMLLEVLVYAVTGALLGIGLGRLFMHIAVSKLLPVGGFIIKYPLWKYLLSFAVSVCVCLTACLAPAIKAGKKTLRELDSSPQKIAKSGNPLIAAGCFAAIATTLAVLKLLSGVYIIIFIVLFIAAAALFISSAVPLTVRFASFVFSKAARTGSMFLSAKSAKRGKGLHTVSVLLIAAIVFCFAVFEVVNIVKVTTTPYLMRYVADFVAVSDGGKDAATQNYINEEFLKIEGVDGAGFFCQTGFLLPDMENTFGLNGVYDDWTLLHCSRGGLSAGTVERWNSTQNPIVLPNEMMLRYNLKTGDTVAYESVNYNHVGEIFEFKIVGIDYTVTEWDFVGYVKFSQVQHMAYGTTYLITADEAAGKTANKTDKNELFLKVRQTAENMLLSGSDGQTSKIEGIYALEFSQWAYTGQLNLSGLSSLLGFLQIFLFAVSLLGIINITVVTVYDRKHEFILYKLNGMSRTDYLKFSLGEGVLTTVSSAIIGLILCIAVNMLLPPVATLINKFISFGVFPLKGLTILAVASAFFMTTWLLIAAFNKEAKITHINGKYNY